MLKTLALATALALSGTAQAQNKKELVQKVLQLQKPGIENVGRAIAAQNTQRILQTAGQALAGVPTDQREAVAKDIQADVKKFYDEVEPILRDRATKSAPGTVGPLYEERFSEAELKQIIAWMESPVSKKLQQVDADVGKTLAQKIVEEARPTLEPKVRALEQQIGQRLQASRAAQPAASAPKK